MPLLNPDSIPGYREAIERETSVRDNAFLHIPETICGIEVQPLTPRHFLILDGIRSPFVAGKIPKPEDVAVFLWVISPQFRPIKTFWDRRIRRKFIRSCRCIGYADGCARIDDYIEDAFQDSPSSGSMVGPSYFSWLAAIVDSLASEYRWSEEAILSLPFKRLFQYLNVIRRRDNPKASLVNRQSLKVRARWLDGLNAPKN